MRVILGFVFNVICTLLEMFWTLATLAFIATICYVVYLKATGHHVLIF